MASIKDIPAGVMRAAFTKVFGVAKNVASIKDVPPIVMEEVNKALTKEVPDSNPEKKRPFFNIGSSGNSLKWDGESLSVKGRMKSGTSLVGPNIKLEPVPTREAYTMCCPKCGLAFGEISKFIVVQMRPGAAEAVVEEAKRKALGHKKVCGRVSLKVIEPALVDNARYSAIVNGDGSIESSEIQMPGEAAVTLTTPSGVAAAADEGLMGIGSDDIAMPITEAYAAARDRRSKRDVNPNPTRDDLNEAPKIVYAEDSLPRVVMSGDANAKPDRVTNAEMVDVTGTGDAVNKEVAYLDGNSGSIRLYDSKEEVWEEIDAKDIELKNNPASMASAISFESFPSASISTMSMGAPPVEGGVVERMEGDGWTYVDTAGNPRTKEPEYSDAMEKEVAVLRKEKRELELKLEGKKKVATKTEDKGERAIEF